VDAEDKVLSGLFGKMLILVCLISALESITCHVAASNIDTGRNGA
jgi:hypothetical protein